MLDAPGILRNDFEGVCMEYELTDQKVTVGDGSFLTEAVGIIRPSSPPSMEFDGKIIKTEASELVANIKQLGFGVFVSNTLNVLAGRFDKEKSLAVKPSLYLDPSKVTGFSLFIAFNLLGAGVDENSISKFRAAMVFIIIAITGKPSFFYDSSMQHLTEEELELLSEMCHAFSVKNSGKRITNEFAVYTGLDDQAGLPVGGQLPNVASGEPVTEILDGLAWAAGYDEFSNLAFLQIIKEADAAASKISFQCRHTEVYDILAQARLERSMVKYRGCRITSATGKKDQWRLDSIELAPADTGRSEHFELTS